MIMNFFNPAPNERLDVIRDLKPGAKGLNLQVIVLDIGTRTTTKDNHELRTFKVADRTGSVNICVWDEPGAYIQQGDILRMHRCYASNYKNQLTVYTGRGGKIVKIGEFAMNFCEVPFMSDPTQMGGAGEQQMVQQQQQQPNNMIQ